ncbi:MAG: TonB-dependent receptor [Deltaproteobacteria bacterium]|nr:TonB-dependent receptor [Deltaproteobacteria bacterium]
MRRKGLKIFGILWLFLAGLGPLQALAAVPPDYTRLSIEELMEIEITSAAKMPQQLSKAAAAIFVITAADIRRSGVTSIPEVLRMAPGLQVARIDSNRWAISSRGFNDLFANKLLVLIDGRTVYSPLYSGVHWDVQDTLLEDIERIEVIRGPGAALWGANAVNGVINILTKNARDTQGGLVTAGAGTEERGFGGLRYGGSLGEKGHYRVWGNYSNRDDSVFVQDGDGADEWEKVQGGFRFDRQGAKNLLTLQGDAYYAEEGTTITETSLTPPYNEVSNLKAIIKGGNLLGRWNHQFSDKSNLRLQLYYDRSDRDLSFYHNICDTADLDFQLRFPLGERHDVIAGLGYRLIHDDIATTYVIVTDPDSRTDQLFSAFVQDTVTLIRDELLLTLGSRFEHNDYSGFEIQPSIRLAWTPTRNFTLWGAASRAVRTPSRIDHDSRVNPFVLPNGGGMPTVISRLPNDDLDSEKVYAVEWGLRFIPSPRVAVDLAAFFNIYEDLVTFESLPPFVETSPEPVHLVIPEQKQNGGDGKTWGFELACDWRPLDWWQLKAAYTFLRMSLDPDGGTLSSDEGNSPRHQISLQSRLDLGEKTTFDLWLRYVDNLPDLGIHSYFGLDARLGYQVAQNLELAVVGQNLLDGRHQEYAFFQNAGNALEMERGVYGKLTWKF